MSTSRASCTVAPSSASHPSASAILSFKTSVVSSSRSTSSPPFSSTTSHMTPSLSSALVCSASSSSKSTVSVTHSSTLASSIWVSGTSSMAAPSPSVLPTSSASLMSHIFSSTMSATPSFPSSISSTATSSTSSVAPSQTSPPPPSGNAQFIGCVSYAFFSAIIDSGEVVAFVPDNAACIVSDFIQTLDLSLKGSVTNSIHPVATSQTHCGTSPSSEYAYYHAADQACFCAEEDYPHPTDLLPGTNAEGGCQPSDVTVSLTSPFVP
ncbi:hypothetical protein IAR55_001026 [Kwoniella newhampshirensis]|uniref:REJ domain-containing protein n=1 Tax=Kwoniella newhampshirensis TaxID=1651941 RepID=A0AAW0Z4V0_9TREE